jgi:transposase InsO family protein
VSRRDWSDAHLVDVARQVHADDPVFGYRFIADELRAEHGVQASENRVARHDDLVRREFRTARPNELWLTDITELRKDEGKLYLCAVKDACSNRIVGYSQLIGPRLIA